MILVTGATGQTGSEIVRQLSGAGVKVRALVRDLKKAAALRNGNVEIVQGDLDREETLDMALKGIEKVYLLSSADPRQVELHSKMIRAAKRAGVKHMVRHSAMGANPNSPVMLGKWHGMSEKELQESGIPFTHLRPHYYMQNTLMFAQTINTQGVFFAPMKAGKIGLVDIRDIAAVAVKTLMESGHEGRTYEITGPESLSFRDVGGILSEVLGKTVTYVDVAPEEARKGMMAAGLPEWLADALLQLYGAFAEGHGDVTTKVVADVAKKQPISYKQFAKDHSQIFSGVVAARV
ncbi:MAG: SDR family oxidoreductase [Armatimonadetes bacterium]|nr:SDR family oxidoreductase [Armatimonadota bacterium]